MTLATVARYTPTAVNRCGDRAVVLGASMAGCAAARVLADTFAVVILIERDASVFFATASYATGAMIDSTLCSSTCSPRR